MDLRDIQTMRSRSLVICRLAMYKYLMIKKKFRILKYRGRVDIRALGYVALSSKDLTRQIVFIFEIFF